MEAASYLVHHRVLPSLQAPVGGVGEVDQSDIDTLWPVQALPHPRLPRPGRGQAAAQGPLPPDPAGAGRGQGLGGAVPRPPPQGGGRAPSQQGQGAGGQAVPDWRPRPLAGTAVIGDEQGGGVEPIRVQAAQQTVELGQLAEEGADDVCPDGEAVAEELPEGAGEAGDGEAAAVVLCAADVAAEVGLVDLHAAQPQAEAAAGGALHLGRLRESLAGRGRVAVLPGADLEVEDTGVGVAAGQVLQEDVLLAGRQGGRARQVDPHLTQGTTTVYFI